MKTSKKILIFGIGNPGRQDDGLGARAVEYLEKLQLPNVTCEADYQLNLEDVLACSKHDIVIFIDAATEINKPFFLESLRDEENMPAMSHTLRPGAVLSLARSLFGKAPAAYILGVLGYEFEIGEGLTSQAQNNLKQALEFLLNFLTKL